MERSGREGERDPRGEALWVSDGDPVAVLAMQRPHHGKAFLRNRLAFVGGVDGWRAFDFDRALLQRVCEKPNIEGLCQVSV